MFGVKLSFVATRSGLLRWVDHIPHNKDSADLYVEPPLIYFLKAYFKFKHIFFWYIDTLEK